MRQLACPIPPVVYHRPGQRGAREVLGALRETNKTKSLELVWTQLLDDSQRTAAVEKFATANPDFGPASYALADEYSEDRLGARTLSEKRAEKAALDAFTAAEKSGQNGCATPTCATMPRSKNERGRFVVRSMI